MSPSVTTEQKFNAAVHVIHNLPKDGPFQPSNDMKLRFYSHFKQATEGPCVEPKPAFWEVVKKAKWDAWSRLGDMSKEDAMNNYVEDLKKIIETMPYTESAADFTEKLGPFYEMVDIPIPRMKEKNLLKNNKIDAANGDVVNGDNVNGDVTDNNNVNETALGLSNGTSKDISRNLRPCDWNDSLSRYPSHLSFGLRDAHSEKFYSGTESDDDEFSDPLQNEGFEDIETESLPLDVITNDSGANGEHVMDEDKTSGRVMAGFLSFQKAQKNGQLGNHVPLSNGAKTAEVGNRQGSKLPNGFAHKVKLSNGPIDGVASRGGGDPTASSRSGRMHRNSDGAMPSQTGKAYSLGNYETLPIVRHPLGMGSGGSQRRGPGGNRAPSDVNEQIAETLFQLQKDMESVLTRLNTLEALTVAHHNIAQGRIISVVPVETESSVLPRWWPFQNMSFKTVAIFLAWPVILHLVINLILANRARRAMRKYRRL